MIYSFGPFHLDARIRRLRRGDDDVVAVPDRHLEILLHLVSHAGRVVSKDALISAAWKDVAVTDNSLEQAISALRRTLGVPPPPATRYIETLARRGYRFDVPVATAPDRFSDDELSAMLAPFRALVDGRAALETFDREAVARACDVFEHVTRAAPDHAPAHLGLANALALMAESVRAERRRDDAALARARHHASEACRLQPSSGEAWGTLSLIYHQTFDHPQAIAAAQRAIALEPDNWRHYLRLSYVSWGDARLRAAHRVLKLLPELAFAHWLAATVHIARQAFDEAEHELVLGAAAQDRQQADTPFRGIGLHLLLGLVRLAAGNEAAAVREFERELALDATRHIYGREAAANAHCALAAVHLRHGRTVDAGAALDRALAAIPAHAVATAATAALGHGAPSQSGQRFAARLAELRNGGASFEAATAEAVHASLTGDSERAAEIVLTALEKPTRPSSGWLIPIDPLLHIELTHEPWQRVFRLLRSRAL
jgi:DNA-binding winged helix-turn-helix (wHTH) protein